MAPPPVRLLLGRLCAALVACSFFAWPAPSRASDATPLQIFRGGGLTMTVQSPTIAYDGARIDCAPGTDRCFLLNLSACTTEPLPIQFVLSAPLSQTAPSYVGGTQVLYAFLSNTPSCIYSSNAAQVGENGTLIGTTAALPSSSVFFSGGSLPFNFPLGLSALNSNIAGSTSNPVFTTVDLLNSLGVCPGTGGTAVDLSPRYLCVGVDGTGNKGGVNNGTTAAATTTATTGTATSSADLVGYLALQVDTSPPATPLTLSVKPKDGRAAATVAYDASTLDVYSVAIRYTDDENDLAAGNVLVDANSTASPSASDPNAAPAGCSAWTNYQQASVLVRAATNGNRVLGVSKLTNGRNYAFCAINYDYLGNQSAPTPVVVAQPREECDLFACYDGTLRVGFCATNDLPALWSAAALGCAWAAARCRRRRPRASAHGGGGRLPLWLAWPVAAATLGLQPDAQAALVRQPPYLQSEAPKDDPQNRPRGSREDTWTAQQTVSHPQNVQFSDPRNESLDYGPERPRKPLFDVDFAIGPYRPQIGRGPPVQAYDLIYGKHDGSLFAGHPLRIRLGGTFYPFASEQTGPYVSASFWHTSGATRVCSTTTGAYTPCTPQTVLQSTAGADSGSLFVVPLSVGWTYAFNLARLSRLPVSIGAKAGLVFNVWWAQSGGEPSRYRGARAQGSTANGEVSAFVAVDLNEFTARTRALREHVLAVVEYQYLPPGALFGSDRIHRLSFGAPFFVTIGLRVQFLRDR